MELTVGFMGVEQRYISDVYLTPNERVEVRVLFYSRSLRTCHMDLTVLSLTFPIFLGGRVR